MSTFTAQVRAALQQRARPDVKAGAERYFRGEVAFHGCKKPVVAEVARALLPLLKSATVEARRKAGLALLRSPYMEERQIGAMLLHQIRKQLPDDVMDDLAAVFDRHVHDWGSCDQLCGQVLREMVGRPSARKRVIAWSRSANPWRQRASAVAFVNEARHGLHDDDVIAICARIVANPHRFVQLGAGWLLRELSLADRPRVLAFIEEHAAQLSREGLRYAVEKMPPSVRARAMAAHASSSRAIRAANQTNKKTRSGT